MAILGFVLYKFLNKRAGSADKPEQAIQWPDVTYDAGPATPTGLAAAQHDAPADTSVDMSGYEDNPFVDRVDSAAAPCQHRATPFLSPTWMYLLRHLATLRMLPRSPWPSRQPLPKRTLRRLFRASHLHPMRPYLYLFLLLTHHLMCRTGAMALSSSTLSWDRRTLKRPSNYLMTRL